MAPTFSWLRPYLAYPDADAAAEWLVRVLGFGPAHCASRDTDGSWAEGHVVVGDGQVELNGGAADGELGGQGGLLIVGVDDVDAQRDRIVAAGVPCDPPRDEAYGPRTCHLTDPWGYRWYFWQGEAHDG